MLDNAYAKKVFIKYSLGRALGMASGASLAVQWLRFHASTAGGIGSIPDQGTKIPHATWHGQKRKINK